MDSERPRGNRTGELDRGVGACSVCAEALLMDARMSRSISKVGSGESRGWGLLGLRFHPLYLLPHDLGQFASPFCWHFPTCTMELRTPTCPVQCLALPKEQCCDM